MAAKRILLLLSSDRSAYPLIRRLEEEVRIFKWKICIGTLFTSHEQLRLSRDGSSSAAEVVTIRKFPECDQLIRKSDLVVAMVTDAWILQIADSCLQHRKTLVSPAPLTRQMVAKKTLAEERKVLFLFDCGFSPGLDHITAKKAIDNIHAKGGVISSFKTYSGTFIPDKCGENPCGFRLAETAADLLNLGRQTNRYLSGGSMQHIPYHQLFQRADRVDVSTDEDVVAIPAGDSLYQRKIYGLHKAHTVVKGKLLPARLARLMGILINLGLTDNITKIDLCGDLSFYNLLKSVVPGDGGALEEQLMSYGADQVDIQIIKWMGLFDHAWIQPEQDVTPAGIVQYLFETKLSGRSDDQDHLLMQHQLCYHYRDEQYALTASFVSKGANEHESALANLVALACGAAAKSVMSGAITTKGLHIPVVREIYDPILNELSDSGFAFRMEDKKIGELEPVSQ